MSILNWMPTKNDGLCSTHFEKKMFLQDPKHVKAVGRSSTTIFLHLPTYLQSQQVNIFYIYAVHEVYCLLTGC